MSSRLSNSWSLQDQNPLLIVLKFTSGDLNRDLLVIWSNLTNGTGTRVADATVSPIREEDRGQRAAVAPRPWPVGIFRSFIPCILECRAFECSENSRQVSRTTEWWFCHSGHCSDSHLDPPGVHPGCCLFKRTLIRRQPEAGELGGKEARTISFTKELKQAGSLIGKKEMGWLSS